MFERNIAKQPKLFDYITKINDDESRTNNYYEMINQRIKSHPVEAAYEDNSSGFTSLLILLYHKRPSVDTIKPLIDAYPLALMTNSAGGTPLHLFIRNSLVAIVELLIKLVQKLHM